MRLRQIAVLVPLLGACDHSQPFTYGTVPLGPSGTASPIRLTFNPSGDSLGGYTSDGRGFLYVYSAAGEPYGDRCLAMLPADGGTQRWTFCDDQLLRGDSATSFGGAALNGAGQLLYFESVGAIDLTHRPSDEPSYSALWLADTAAPLDRRLVARFSGVAPDGTADWLVALAWIDSTTFTALGEHFDGAVVPGGFDTILNPVAVVRGSVTSNVITPVAGTEGATSYSLAENGTAIVFTAGTLVLQRVPVDGGPVDTATTIPAEPQRAVLDVSCHATTCVVLTIELPPGDRPDQTTNTYWRLDLTTGALTKTLTTWSGANRATLAPGSGDVVVQRGLDLYLYPGLVP